MNESSPPSTFRDRRAVRRVVAVTLAFAIAGFVYGALAPEWFRPVLTIVPVTGSKSSGLASLLGGDIGGLVAGLGGGGGADGARIVAVLQSASVADAAIDKFDLMKRFGAKHREGARDELWRRCETRIQPKPNLIQLSCEDKDPKFAMELLTFLFDHGNQVFRRVNRSSASEEVLFLEARAAELRLQADATAARVREFQETHQIVDLDAQARAVVSEVASLNSQRIAKKVELGWARAYASKDEPTARQLESQLSVVDEQLVDLEGKAPPPSPKDGSAPVPRAGQPAAKRGMFPVAVDVPKLKAEYEKLLRDKKVTEATLVYVMERLEGAKAAEARNVSTFQILDPPTLPTRKTRPFRALILVGATFLGFAVSMAFEWWKSGGLASFLRRLRTPAASPGESSPGGTGR